MPVQPTYPGVYIQELPSGVRTLSGVATSIAAFVGYFSRGPLNEAVQIFNFGDFERAFGGLHPDSEASYAIQQFFLNGGGQAQVIRVAGGTPAAASVVIGNAPGASPDPGLRVEAIHAGSWGANLRVYVDHATPETDEFNLTVTEYDGTTGAVLRQEKFRNLTLDVDGPRSNFVTTVINDTNSGSDLIRIREASANESEIPAMNGTVSGSIADPTEVDLSGSPAMTVTQDPGDPAAGVSVSITAPTGPQTLANLARALENAIRSAQPGNRTLANAGVFVVGDRLQVLAGGEDPEATLTFGGAAADALQLTGAATVNLQAYPLRAVTVADTAQGAVVPGTDGDLPDAGALIGSLNDKTGLFALEDVDLFNILCIPRLGIIGGAGGMSEAEAGAVYATANAYCEQKRAFFIHDTPLGTDEVPEIQAYMTAHSDRRHRNAALYYPRVRVPDPLNGFRLRSVGACGTIAGLYARTDNNRGVWKSPAGTEARLINVPELSDTLSDAENGVLNPIGVNCLRNFPVYGTVSWGARTLEGADQMASEYKYVAVRRLTLFLEESLYRGTKWVVFEPNDEPLWAQIRLNVGAFMNTLFRQGAFQGSSPKEAYLVKCDAETTTQNDINQGIVNVLVGFAPLKPAEFVIISIQQLAGQIQV